MFLYAGLPFVAPIAMRFGLTWLADAIYTTYAPLCHQFAFRSWFLFGEQTEYPREMAGLPEKSFEDIARTDPAFAGIDVATLDANLIYVAKDFRGNPQIGWKVAFCQRDVTMYASIALFGVGYAILRRMKVKVPHFPVWAYLLVAIAPIGLDGFSQLFSNPPFYGFGLSLYPIRESTPLLRVVTGALFGIGNTWLAFPYMEESMTETKLLMETKLRNAGVIS